jgi:hypothetical protein
VQSQFDGLGASLNGRRQLADHGVTRHSAPPSLAHARSY